MMYDVDCGFESISIPLFLTMKIRVGLYRLSLLVFKFLTMLVVNYAFII